MSGYVIALDQGTTSSRCILFDREQRVISSAQKEFAQIYPKPGWVEHDPTEIWSTQYGVMMEAIAKSGLNASDAAAIGITNQRETTVVWERDSGRPIYNAIVWQCRRTSDICTELRRDEKFAEHVRRKTGLLIDAYFSGSKIKWILDNVPGARDLARDGKLLFGTIDSWLIWKLTGGKVHATDRTNASRTMLYDIGNLKWDEEICARLDIPMSMLPDVRPSGGGFGSVNIQGTEIPISGAAGDQQAALFGQACFEAGQAKNTYGTGCFLLMNTGSKRTESKNGLLTTIAATVGTDVAYAVEGSVFVGGAVVQWLRDEMRLITEASDSEYFARKVGDSGGVYIVPAFTGLGAPHWDMNARGAILGLTRGAGRSHIIRAALESIAYQSSDVLSAMENDTGVPLKDLRVDGGASANDFLMQFQADIIGRRILRPVVLETTALGAALLAGISVGFWSGLDDVRRGWTLDRAFDPEIDDEKRKALRAGWTDAVDRVKCG